MAIMVELEFHSPCTQKEALGMLRELPDTRIIAGGTDLLVLMKDLLVQPGSVLSLGCIQDLAESDLNQNGLRLGPMMPLWRLEKWKAVGKAYPALLQAVRSLAAPPIRNQGTVGGNLCLDTKCIYYNQSQVWKRQLTPCLKAGGEVCHVAPAGKRCLGALTAETIGPLSIYGAELTLTSSVNARSIPIQEFFTGDGLRPHNMSPEEMITTIQLPLPPPRSGSVYYRFANRKALEFSQVNLTGSLSLDDGGRVTSARLIIGSIGPAPVEVKESLSGIIGEVPSEHLWAQVARGVAREAVRVSRSPRLTPYLQDVVTANAERLFKKTWQQALGNQT
jgi:4-hydroxybenzoyl-CoA reductase subunit beta